MAAPTNLTLADVSLGNIATVTNLHSSGVERRRMMDLGILPGAKIEVAMENPLGDPTAYNIRGAIIALRREQARLIEVSLADTTKERVE